MKYTLHVDREDPVVFRLAYLQHRPVDVRGSGIVDKDVEAAKGGDRLLNYAIDIGFFAHIASQRDGAVANGAGGGFGRIGIDIGERDPRALARVGLCNALTDARTGPGHKRDFAFEAHIDSGPPRLPDFARCQRRQQSS
jgi:hypothetical protein